MTELSGPVAAAPIVDRRLWEPRTPSAPADRPARKAVVHGDGVPAQLTTHAVRAVAELAPLRELAPATTQDNGAGAVA